MSVSSDSTLPSSICSCVLECSFQNLISPVSVLIRKAINTLYKDPERGCLDQNLPFVRWFKLGRDQQKKSVSTSYWNLLQEIKTAYNQEIKEKWWGMWLTRKIPQIRMPAQEGKITSFWKSKKAPIQEAKINPFVVIWCEVRAFVGTFHQQVVV